MTLGTKHALLYNCTPWGRIGQHDDLDLKKVCRFITPQGPSSDPYKRPRNLGGITTSKASATCVACGARDLGRRRAWKRDTLLKTSSGGPQLLETYKKFPHTVGKREEVATRPLLQGRRAHGLKDDAGFTGVLAR